MYEEAVDTALQVGIIERKKNQMKNACFSLLKFNVKLAKECAQAVQSNDERTKKLWLKIGKQSKFETNKFQNLVLNFS